MRRAPAWWARRRPCGAGGPARSAPAPGASRCSRAPASSIAVSSTPKRSTSSCGRRHRHEPSAHARPVRSALGDARGPRRGTTKRRPDHVPSIAQTLLSTRPASSPTRCTASNARSVATPDVFFGHATHSPPSVSSARANDGNRRASSAAPGHEEHDRRRGGRARAVRSSHPAGSGRATSSNPSGADDDRDPASPPGCPTSSGSGVPEYPLLCVAIARSRPPRPPRPARRFIASTGGLSTGRRTGRRYF